MKRKLLPQGGSFFAGAEIFSWILMQVCTAAANFLRRLPGKISCLLLPRR